MLYRRIKFAFRGNRIGKSTYIDNNVYLKNTYISRFCYIGSNCIINSAEIGSYCSIASGTQIGGMEHSVKYLSTSTYLSDECVVGQVTTIAPDVWIAADCIIKQGISIGQGAVVGANSFVNKDVPPYAIVVGSPAKIIRYRFDSDVIQILIDSSYPKYEPKQAKEILQQINERII